MSQMKPYCFKCGAELDPDAIYCPECGRLQRSMVVRSVDPGAPSAPPAPHPGSPPEQPVQFYPDREDPAAPGAEAHPDAASYRPDSAWQQPDQPDPYAHQQYSDQSWQRGEQHTHDETVHDPAYGHDAWAAEPYAEQPAADGEHVYGQQTDPEPGPAEHSWSTTGYDDHSQQGQAEHGYAAPAEPDAVYGEPEPPGYPEPWHRASEAPYGQAEPVYEPPAPAADPWHREPEPAETHYAQPEPSYGPAASDPGRAEPTYTAPEPIYSSSAPPPAGGDAYRSYPASPPSNPYSPAAANPYAPPYRADAGQRQGPSPIRIVALAAAALLGLFLIGFGIGHLLGVGGNSAAPSAAVPPQQTTAPTTAPTSTPARTPSATPTPDQGVTGSARFQRVSSSIPGRCTTSQGCPIQVTLKNNGGQGSGTVTVTLTDAPNGNPLATFTGPVPVTDAGATVQVTGFANGDQLPGYLRSGGTVYISSIDVKSGG